MSNNPICYDNAVTSSDRLARSAECYIGLQCSERALVAASAAIDSGASEMHILAAFVRARAAAMNDSLFIENKLKQFRARVSNI